MGVRLRKETALGLTQRLERFGSWRLLSLLAVVSCGGGGGTSPAPDAAIGPSADAPSQGTSEQNVRSVFPPARPVVDPDADIADVERYVGLTVEGYEALMNEAFRQINEIVRTIQSGVDSSDDPSTLARDARLYSEIVSGGCGAIFDGTGQIVELIDCGPDELAFRHPTFGGIILRIDAYALATGTTGRTDVEIHSGDIRATSVRTLEIRTHGRYLSDDPKENEPTRVTAVLSVPGGFIGETEQCTVNFDPFLFDTGRLDVNKCAAIFGDTATVVQRLSSR